MKRSRLLDKKLERHFSSYKQALILLGARQVGKTTILKKLFPRALYLLVDEKPIFDNLESYNSDVYQHMIGESKQIFIDELHLLSNPGRAVKLIYDQLERVQIIVTGSSSLHIKNKTAESMAGRAVYYYLYPLTLGEYFEQSGLEKSSNVFIYEKIVNGDQAKSIKNYDLKRILEQVLLYGQYPETVNQRDSKVYLKNLIDKAIFKDIIELNLIENRSKALELLKLLAYQIGNLISYSKLANILSISVPTIQRYIDIFEQSFIVYRLFPFSRNARSEIGKAPKIYFWDLGLRNALINNFDSINLRADAGAMFENFIITEVKKEVSYLDLGYQVKYWRLKSGSEVDLLLHHGEKIIACEVKLGKGKLSRAFQNRYPQAKTQVVSIDNFI